MKKEPEGLSKEGEQTKWRKAINKPIPMQIRWRCACGGGAPLAKGKCEKCGSKRSK